MTLDNKDQFLWVEKYRPRCIDECILPEEIKQTFVNFLKNEELPNLLLSGGAGIGKTTVARALCEESGADYIVINGSEESGIDVLRTKIKQFASTVSFTNSRKIVIIDEADYLNPQSTQPALRGFIEEFSNNCGFIFTCNWKNRIIEPIHSRCSVIDFKIPGEVKVQLAKQFFGRIKGILDGEGITYENKVVAEVIKKHFPDFRGVLNELQRYAAGGTIDTGILAHIGEVNIKVLIDSLKGKRIQDDAEVVVDNIDNDPQKIFRKIYDSMYDFIDPSSIPQTVVTLADYQYRAAFCADHEVNLVACLTELMVETKWK